MGVLFLRHRKLLLCMVQSPTSDRLKREIPGLVSFCRETRTFKRETRDFLAKMRVGQRPGFSR